MPGDYSRNTFDATKHYSGVLMQQGRVQLDADWNEQLAILLHRTQTQTDDVIGLCGVPKKGEGFKIDVSDDHRDLTIAPGRIYVDGLLCELDHPTTYATQPYLPNPEYTQTVGGEPASPPDGTALELDDGLYLVFLDAWQREVTALDDRRLREVALGGPDTTVRLQTVWQVKLLPVSTTVLSPPGEFPSPPTSPPGCSPLGGVTCETPFPEYDACTAPSTGMVTARTKPAGPQANPCELPPSVGYNRLENQLYRVEVHTGGDKSAATFKWSRENASIETHIDKIEDDVLTVSDVGKDDVLGFGADQWVEIVNQESSLKHMPRDLVQIKEVDPTKRTITLTTSVMELAGQPGLKLRRWDQAAQANSKGTSAGLPVTSAGWIDLEGNIQVRFSDGTYHSGDYWVIPARTATGEIEWPPFDIPNTNPLPQPPRGVRHHYCRLALLDASNGLLQLADCRPQFPALTELGGADESVRLHNKFLHGPGIVCGLKVHCDPEDVMRPENDDLLRTRVVIDPGYALDCEGHGITVPAARTYEVVREAVAAGLLDAHGDGEVCIRLDRASEHGCLFSVEAGPGAQSFLDGVLEGTLLKDFYKHCVEELIDLVKLRFLPIPDDTVPTAETQKRLISVVNLLLQIVNAASGSYVFISPAEYALLKKWYYELRAKLQSHSFCAMFQRDFPDYPASFGTPPPIDTAFGLLKFHYRLRVHPSGQFAYTCRPGPTIQHYDLKQRTVTALLEFPVQGVQVQDVAFSPEGDAMYVVAVKPKDATHFDSYFATVTIGTDRSHTWGPVSVVCDYRFVTLATHAKRPNTLFAVAKGHGVHAFTADNILSTSPAAPPPPPNPAPVTMSFRATGLFTVSPDSPIGYAAESNAMAGPNPAFGDQTDAFARIRKLALDTGQVLGNVFEKPGHDSNDDLVFHKAANVPQGLVQVTAQGITSTVRALYTLDAVNLVPQPPDGTAFQGNGPARVAGLADTSVMVSLSDQAKVIRMSGNPRQVQPNFRVPVQFMPTGLAAVDTDRLCALNFLSNTISMIEAAPIIANPPPPLTSEPPVELRDFRQAMLNAYFELFSHLAQYLKDCFCEQFLVSCPDCRDTTLYLGCVEIKDGRVYNICNWTKRRYSKTVQTYDYWLSAIPVLPLLKKILAELCCKTL